MGMQAIFGRKRASSASTQKCMQSGSFGKWKMCTKIDMTIPNDAALTDLLAVGQKLVTLPSMVTSSAGAQGWPGSIAVAGVAGAASGAIAFVIAGVLSKRFVLRQQPLLA